MARSDDASVVDYFRWRQADALRCSLNGWCYWTLRKAGKTKREATSALQGGSFEQKRELLASHGVNLAELAGWQRQGVGIFAETYEKVGRACTPPDAAPGAMEAEAGWQAGRLVEYLLAVVSDLVPYDPNSLPKSLQVAADTQGADGLSDHRQSLREGARIRCSFFVVAQIAAVDEALRSRVWVELGRTLSNDGRASVLPVASPTGSDWWQLRVRIQPPLLSPRALIRYLRSVDPGEAFLLFRQSSSSEVELVRLGRHRWLEVEERVGLAHRSRWFRHERLEVEERVGLADRAFRFRHEREEEEDRLPRPPMDAHSLMGRHAEIAFEAGVPLGTIREASEYLADLLKRWEDIAEEERVAVLDAHPAERARRDREAERDERRRKHVPKLHRDSRETLAALPALRDGATTSFG